MNIFSSKYLIFILLILPLSVKATPFHIDAKSGYQGGSVTLALFDSSTDNLEAAELRISYDPAMLFFDPTDPTKFSKVEPGSLTGGNDLSLVFYDYSTSGIVDVSIATSISTPINNEAGPLLFVTFDILSNAVPGDTDVSIGCLNFVLPPTPCEASSTVYYVPTTIGTVTILQKTTDVSEPEIFMLMLLGLFGYIGLTKNKKIPRL